MKKRKPKPIIFIPKPKYTGSTGPSGTARRMEEKWAESLKKIDKLASNLSTLLPSFLRGKENTASTVLKEVAILRQKESWKIVEAHAKSDS